MTKPFSQRPTLCVLGMSNVGLLLALTYGREFETVGFDMESDRIRGLQAGHDRLAHVDEAVLQTCRNVRFSTFLDDLAAADVYIIAPKTGECADLPDIAALKNMTDLVGLILEREGIVIYAADLQTAYLKDYCVPIIESVTDMRCNDDFFVGSGLELAIKDRFSHIKSLPGTPAAVVERMEWLVNKLMAHLA